MIETILAALKKAAIDKFIINQSEVRSAELFFVKKDLDMRRTKNVLTVKVTVYRDFDFNGEAMLGFSDCILSPDMSEEAMSIALKSAYDAAQYVKNKTFELYSGAKAEMLESDSSLKSSPLTENALKMAEALFQADTRSDAFVNSAEIFVSARNVHILSSTGTDVRYEKYACEGEFVVQCKEPQDVEQYFSFSYDGLDTDALTEKVTEALKTVCDRASASKRPKAGKYDIVLSGDNLATILSLYFARSDASMVYSRYSDWKPGKEVQGDSVSGEKLDLDLLPIDPYSSDGIPMKERKLIRNGVLELISGATRFCRYLGIEPTGSYRRGRLNNGTVSFEEMKKGCLYPVSFSDFQMDEMTGNFGGEIRLAYYFDGDSVHVLTGGSINGSLFETQKDMCFSTERYKSAEYEGPFAVKLKGVPVNGEE